MRYRILTILLVGMFSHQNLMAQYDTYMFYQGLNQMVMNFYQQLEANDKILIDAINAEAKRMDANATASCVMLPYGEDLFYAQITLLYVNANNVRIEVEDIFGDVDVVPSSSYVAVGQNIVTNSMFEPGSTVYIKRKDTNKVLAKSSIPSKSSSNYAQYLANAYLLARRYNNMNNSSSNFDYSTEKNTTSRSTCSYCGGKGWVEGSKTPVYGSSTQRWCDECDKLVNPSHSHDMCPACMGKGYK